MANNTIQGTGVYKILAQIDIELSGMGLSTKEIKTYQKAICYGIWSLSLLEHIYFPQHHLIAKAIRDELIYHLCNYSNKNRVAKRFNLSVAYIDKIIKQQRHIRSLRRLEELPGKGKGH